MRESALAQVDTELARAVPSSAASFVLQRLCHKHQAISPMARQNTAEVGRQGRQAAGSRLSASSLSRRMGPCSR